MRPGQTFTAEMVKYSKVTEVRVFDGWIDPATDNCYAVASPAIKCRLQIGLSDDWQYRCKDVFPFGGKEYIICAWRKSEETAIIELEGICYDNMHAV